MPCTRSSTGAILGRLSPRMILTSPNFSISRTICRYLRDFSSRFCVADQSLGPAPSDTADHPLRYPTPLLCFTYTSHYNRRHTRVGHLYQGQHKIYLIVIEAYISHVSRYIQLNPDKVTSITKVSSDKKLHFLMNYQWSSLRSKHFRERGICHMGTEYVSPKPYRP